MKIIITQEENRRTGFGGHYWLICKNCNTRWLAYGIFIICNDFCKCGTDDFVGGDFPHKTTILCA